MAMRRRFDGEFCDNCCNKKDILVYTYDIINQKKLMGGIIEMEIKKTLEGEKLTVAISGRLDTTTAPELEEALKESMDGISELVIDFTETEYISSAGLRVLLSAQKTMNKQGSMIVTGVNDVIMEIFEVTGFVDILDIQ